VGKGTQTDRRTSKSLVIRMYKDSCTSFHYLSNGNLFIFWFSKDFKGVNVNNGWHKICSLLEQAFNPYVLVVHGNVIHEFYGEMGHLIVATSSHVNRPTTQIVMKHFTFEKFGKSICESIDWKSPFLTHDQNIQYLIL
jgi:hypothetical protein